MRDYPSLAEEDKKWRADSDARTLMEAEEVRKDGDRHNLAKVAAEKLAKEKESEACSLKSVAQGIVKYPSMPEKSEHKNDE